MALNRRRFTCSRQTPECSRVGVRPSMYRHFLSLATCQAPRSIFGSDPVVNADNIVRLSRLIDTPPLYLSFVCLSRLSRCQTMECI